MKSNISNSGHVRLIHKSVDCEICNHSPHAPGECKICHCGESVTNLTIGSFNDFSSQKAEKSQLKRRLK